MKYLKTKQLFETLLNTRDFDFNNYSDIKSFIDEGGDVNNFNISLLIQLTNKLTWNNNDDEREDKIKTIKLLLDNGADVNQNITDSKSNQSPLFRSIKTRNEEIINLFIDAGADVNYNNGDYTILEHALISIIFAKTKDKFSKDIIYKLIKNGAVIGIKEGDYIDGTDRIAKTIKKWVLENYPEKWENYIRLKNLQKYNI